MIKSKFGREIGIILFIKLTLLYALWNLCFKDHKTKIISDKFANHVFDLHFKDQHD